MQFNDLPEELVKAVKKWLLMSFETMLPHDTVVTQPYSGRNFFLPLIGEDYLGQPLAGSVSYTVRSDDQVDIAVSFGGSRSRKDGVMEMSGSTGSDVRISLYQTTGHYHVTMNVADLSLGTVSDVANGLRLLSESLFEDLHMRVAQRILSNVVSMMSNHTTVVQFIQKTKKQQPQA